MKSAFTLLACLTLLLPACTPAQREQAFTGRTVQVSYDDLGPASLVQPLLGPRGANPMITINTGGSNFSSNPRKLNARQAINLLHSNAKRLPRTPENEPLRQRMSHAYDRIFGLYNARRAAVLSVPPFFGRGSTARMRMMMVPPVSPRL
ncbi:MAG: hypothetical protein R3F13_03825 [Prosthecobacter sp.]